MAVLPDRNSDGKLPKYTSVGCYPLFYITKKCDVLCADCASEAAPHDCNTCTATGNKPYSQGEPCPDCIDGEVPGTAEPPVGYDVNWENSILSCEVCGSTIECAYVDPEAK